MGKSGCFEGSKQNIMRKTKGGKKKKKMLGGLLVKELGSGFSHKDSRNTHVHVLRAHIDVCSWFSFSARQTTSCLRCKTILKVCNSWHDALTARLLPRFSPLDSVLFVNFETQHD